MAKQIRKAHEQHTYKFNQEVNRPTNVKEPFRISDGRFIFGKYKGKTLNEVPVSYLEWILETIPRLASSRKALIKEEIEKRNQ